MGRMVERRSPNGISVFLILKNSAGPFFMGLPRAGPESSFQNRASHSNHKETMAGSHSEPNVGGVGYTPFPSPARK